MPHGRHIYAKSYDMAKARICANSQSDHSLPHWKCVLRFCVQCASINIPDQETDDNNSNCTPSIFFHVYHLVARCTKHGRIPLTDKKSCRECQHGTASGQSTKIYTRKELVMMETTISNFHQKHLFWQAITWRFILPMYKYWLQITVATLFEPFLKPKNFQYVLCHRDYAERVVSSFSNKIQS